MSTVNPAGMATPPLSPDEFRAAAEVYRELGPEYGDSVAESFVERVNGEIEARVGARIGSVSVWPGKARDWRLR